MAHIDLHRVPTGVVAIAQRHTVLRAVAVDGVVLQVVFAALQRGCDQVRTFAPFVLEQVAAQARVRQVDRGLGFVFVARIGHAELGFVGAAPLCLPIEAQRMHGVQVAVILAQATVVAAVGVAHHQRAFEAVHAVELHAHAGIASGIAVAILVRVLASDGAGVEAIALVTQQAQCVVHGATGTADTSFELGGAPVAYAHGDKRRKALLTAFGRDLDHTAQGVRAVHRACRAAQHFDAVNQSERNGFPRGAAGGLRVHAHTIDVHGSKT